MKIRKRKILITRIMAIIIMLIIVRIMINKKDKKEEVENETLETLGELNVDSKPEIDSKVTDWNLILINKDNKIPEDYEFDVAKIGYNNQVDERIEKYLNEMLDDAKKAGLKPLICSSYRKSEEQESLFTKKVKEYKRQGYDDQEAEEKASYWVTFPRTSEHEIGLAVDIVSANYQVLDEEQEKTDLQKWLIDHCVDYGFVLRYPTDKKDITKINYEPWHYRYVGVENAKFMKEKGFCLEEYIEYLKSFMV